LLILTTISISIYRAISEIILFHIHIRIVSSDISFVVAAASICRWSPSSEQPKFIDYLRCVPTVGATKCTTPIGAEWNIAPIMRVYGQIPWSGGQGAFARTQM